MLKVRSLLELQELLSQDIHRGLIEKFKEDPMAALQSLTHLPEEEDYKGKPFASVQQLRTAMDKDPKWVDLIRHDPVTFLNQMIKEPPPPQFRVYRIMIGSLCALLIIIVIGVLSAWLTKNSRDAPTLITAVACTTLGMLTGMFVNMTGKKTQPE